MSVHNSAIINVQQAVARTNTPLSKKGIDVIRLHFSLLVFMTITSAIFPLNAIAIDEGDKLLIEIGSLSTNADTKLSVNGTGGNVGATIDLEEDIGYESGIQINRINLRYRFTDKHSLKYAFFQLDRTSNRVIDRNLTIGDTEFQLNANITSDFDYSLHSISYGYSLRSDDDSRLDLLAGLYYITTKFSIAESNLGKFESVSVSAPLPMVGLNFEKKLAGQWNLSTSATIFKLDFEEYNGTLYDLRIRVDYQFTDRFGLGLAYNWHKLDAGVKHENAIADFNLTANGAEITAVMRF